MNKTIIRPARFDPAFSEAIDAELEKRDMNFSEAARIALAIFFGINPYIGMEREYYRHVAEYRAGRETEPA